MNCENVREELLGLFGVEKLPPEIVEHLRSCEDCRAEWDNLVELAAQMPPDESFYPDDSEADRFVVLVDESKMVGRLGSKMPVPVEVVPMAERAVARRIEAMGGSPILREGQRKDGPVVTDQGFWILDCSFDLITDPAELDRELSTIPGVLEHGLFIGMASDAFVGSTDGSVRHLSR